MCMPCSGGSGAAVGVETLPLLLLVAACVVIAPLLWYPLLELWPRDVCPPPLT